MQNKSKVVLMVIVAIVMVGGLGLALKMKNLSSNLKSSTTITSSLKMQIDKLQEENEGHKEKLKEVKEVSKYQGVNVSKLEKEKENLKVRVLDLQKEKAELEKV